MHVKNIKSCKELWDNVLVDIELNISKANFSTWFKGTHIVKFEEGVVYLGVPNQFSKEWLSSKYHKTILRSLRSLSDEVRSVEYLIAADEKKRKKEEPSWESGVVRSGELPLAEHYINKNDNLNPRYTFDSFVVGGFNELAYAAAQAIIKKPGIAYNPLFVYGPTGHGKTHLIQAIGNYLKQTNSNTKIFYVTSERFTVDYTNSIQSGKANTFKEKYRQYDVLVMDDVQFFSKKDATQEELFHLFNVLYENNKQIIFSSDKHPNYIPHLEDRLKSRFSAGMIVDIPTPDLESRSAILRSKAERNNLFLNDDIIEFLAESAVSNIRELEGLLNLLICHTELREQSLTIQEVKQLIKNSAAPKKTMSVPEVVRMIAEFYNLTEEYIYQKTRRKEVVRPRQLIMYILREDFKVSYPTIGEKVGGRDHTTVIHSCEKVKKDLLIDASLAREVEQIRTILR